MIKTIQEICTVVRGSSPRPQGDPRYYGGKIPRLMVSDLTRDGMYVTPMIDSLTEEGALKSRPMKKGEIVIAVSGNPGEPCILSIDACIHDGFVGLRDLDEKITFPPYLYQYLKFIKETNKAKAVGAIYKNLNTDQIKSFEIPLPPLATQKKIAAILDAADAYRQKTKTLIDKYDQLAQSLFLNMFGDPVRNEKGWVMEKLNNVNSKIGSGATPSGGKESYQNEGVSLIRSMNIYDNGFKYKDLAFLNEDQAEKLKNVTVEENDVLFNITGASVCRCCIVPPGILPARVNQHVSILRPKNEILTPIFLSRLLVSENCKKQLLGIGTQGGATREAITKEQLEKFEIILPPIALQNQFAERIHLIEAQKQQAQSSLQKAEDLFNSLLQRAFKGELVS